MECLGLDLSLGFKGVDDILVAPAILVTQSLDGTPFSARLQSQHTQGLGNDHLLLTVVRRRHALEEFQSLKSSGTSGGLVRSHSTDGLVEDSRGSSVVERTALLGVDQMSLVHVIGPTKLKRDIAICKLE
jgi:hypothetical protein